MKRYLQLRSECICDQTDPSFEILEDSEELRYKPIETKQVVLQFCNYKYYFSSSYGQ